MIPRPTGPFVEAIDSLEASDDATAHDKHLVSAWSKLKGTNTLDAIQLLLHNVEAHCLEAVLDANASPDRRQYLSGQVAGVRTLWEAISTCAHCTEEQIKAPEYVAEPDAASAPPAEEPVY